ncbi:PBECR3 domain-containing polyvalent protein, partial [Helicobacter bizzozeronii]
HGPEMQILQRAQSRSVGGIKDNLPQSNHSEGKIESKQEDSLKPSTAGAQKPPTNKSLPTKSTLTEDLSPAEIKSQIEQWDLTNPKATDRLLIGKVEGKELEQLSQEFKFNGNYALARQIDAQHVAHALNRHGDLKVETSRNQIPITMEDIANYPNIIKEADVREIEGDNIVYKKQINGYFVVVEEALTKKNEISFVTMWKSKGNLTTLPTPSSKGYDLDRTLSESYKESNPTKPPLKTPKIEPNPEGFNYTTEGIKGLKELREDLKQALSPILNQDIKNKETGVIARLSSTGLNKISSSKALEKSIANGFSKEEHCESPTR